MNISKVAKATGLTAKTIRYYESIGLITAPVRSDNGYRSYTEGALRELRFVKRARETGFNLEECQELLALTVTNTEPVPRRRSWRRRRSSICAPASPGCRPCLPPWKGWSAAATGMKSRVPDPRPIGEGVSKDSPASAEEIVID